MVAPLNLDKQKTAAAKADNATTKKIQGLTAAEKAAKLKALQEADDKALLTQGGVSRQQSEQHQKDAMNEKLEADKKKKSPPATLDPKKTPATLGPKDFPVIKATG